MLNVDLWVTVENKVAVIHFPFLNEAMSTDQCKRLTATLQETCSRSDVKVVVLAGGLSAWSNGINLNTIEASADPNEESW
jgi:putative two-component system hydrogenase maturation factor HypX/HoxX